MDLKHILIALILGYAFGNIPNGYLYAKSQGVDIYKHGSGNPGSTNVNRVLGKKAGFTVLLLDIAKTIVPILLLNMLWKPETQDYSTLISLYTGLGAIVGHDFPIMMQFRGGKGVACTGATIIAFDYRLAIILLILFILIVYITRYVSLGSMLGVSAFCLATILFKNTDFMPFTAAISMQVHLITGIMAAITIYLHRGNVKRLLSGTENKFGAKK